ncbi:Eukaryotic translation initiation factor 3 subunit L [Diplonema papillatum]|nr:Eukaryotic translation initiation factor 3 subunit L [Diplonema papillatum]
MQFGGEVGERCKRFLEELNQRLAEKDAAKIHELKEVRFGEWAAEEGGIPKPEIAAKKLGYANDDLVMLLYRELYTRHIYSVAKKPEDIRIEDRADAWSNYLALFNKVLDGPEHVTFDLPNSWLYDIVDELVYQLVVYCRYRAERRGAQKKDAADEADKLRDIQQHPTIWDPKTVIRILHKLIQKSDIVSVLAQIKQGKMTAADVLSPGPSHVTRVWGYFSMVGLLRVHTLMGDYNQALKAVDHIDFTPEKEGEKIFKKVQACHITILYYAGFAYMMMRRHYDAVRILLQALRSRSLESAQTTNQTVSNIAKMRENCARLLAMALELAGRRPEKMGDETAASLLMQRVKKEDLEVLKQGNEDSVGTFKSLFMQACPRFILSAAALDILDSESGKKEALNMQLSLFLREVRQQLRLPILRSYLKLYSTIPLEKLASTATEAPMEDGVEVRTASSEAEKAKLTRELLCLKHKSRQLACNWQAGGAPIQGTYKCLADADFYLDRNIIHIDADFRRPQTNCSYFVSNIESLRNVTKGLNPHDIFRQSRPAV